MITFRIMKNALILIALLIVNLSFSQSSDDVDCYKISHLDFFGLENLETEIRWPESEIKGIRELSLKKQKEDASSTLNFIVPAIVYQLQEMHPNCVEKVDTEYLERLIDLYFVLRGLDQTPLKKRSISEQIDTIRDDFYELLKDDLNLIKMSFTLDDGPFYGIDTEEKGTLDESLETNFGSLDISSIDGQPVLTAMNKNGEQIWSKIITGLQGRSLGEIDHSEFLLTETSLATTIHLYAEGEALTLYVKNDGRFMYYFHSW